MIFSGFEVDTPPNWQEISNDNIFAICTADGCGRLEFSVTEIDDQNAPGFDAGNLLALTLNHATSENLGEKFDTVTESTYPAVGAASFIQDEKLIRIWHLSDGKNILRATFACTDAGSETIECESIVRSFRVLD